MKKSEKIIKQLKKYKIPYHVYPNKEGNLEECEIHYVCKIGEDEKIKE